MVKFQSVKGSKSRVSDFKSFNINNEDIFKRASKKVEGKYLLLDKLKIPVYKQTVEFVKISDVAQSCLQRKIDLTIFQNKVDLKIQNDDCIFPENVEQILQQYFSKVLR